MFPFLYKGSQDKNWIAGALLEARNDQFGCGVPTLPLPLPYKEAKRNNVGSLCFKISFSGFVN